VAADPQMEFKDGAFLVIKPSEYVKSQGLLKKGCFLKALAPALS
jgi:hypothetical protein